MDNGLCICRDDVALFIAVSTDYHYYHTGNSIMVTAAI